MTSKSREQNSTERNRPNCVSLPSEMRDINPPTDAMTQLQSAAARWWNTAVIALLGESPPANLPARLNGVVVREQQRGELIISWVEAAVVLIWGVLYALSPKISPANAPFTPVPWTLATYGVFIAGRLLLTYRRPLADWQIALSIIVDIGVLMLLIWSFHLQYSQPPAFYLKAPTLLYVFIFIALRTLRFEARWVLLAGIGGAIGWGGLLAYALAVQWHSSLITHDYVRYMTSSSILLGAEFDKIVSILMVTAVLTVALYRVRRLMMRCIVDHAAALELSRFVDHGIAQIITLAEISLEPGQAEVRSAAALFVDLRSFTILSRRLPPYAVMELLAEYQKRVIPVVQRHHGSIDKFLGDGIMVSFGAVTPSQTYAADALWAMDAITDELKRWQADRVAAGLVAPGIGIGVASGDMLFGMIGDATRLEYTVIGDAVNLAAKLEKQAKVERVTALSDRVTFELARSQGYVPAHAWEFRDRRIVEGLGEPVDLVAIGR